MTRESGYYPDGAEFDPRAPWNEPTPPTAVCQECRAEWDEGDFHDEWVAGLDPYDREDIGAQMPETCPECHPEDFALEADPDHQRKVNREFLGGEA